MQQLKQIVDKWQTLIQETLPELEQIWLQISDTDKLTEAAELIQYIDERLKMDAGLEHDKRSFDRAYFLLTDIRFLLVRLDAGCVNKNTSKKVPRDTMSDIQKLLTKLTPAELAKLKGL